MPACARILAFLLLLVGGLTQETVAQGYYTLTNGRLWWSNGLVYQSDSLWLDPVAFDASNGWSEVHPHGNDHVTHITQQGDTYLALDITSGIGSPESPRLVSIPHAGFSLYCLWYRTGYTGYYYQEWFNPTDQKTYRYYLVGSSSEGLSVESSEVGMPLKKSSYFYDWDFGAAVWEKPTVGGVQQNRYYWIMLANYDAAGNHLSTPVWRMSANSYQRPEDIYYVTYTEGDDEANDTNRRYYDGVYDVGYVPAGNGALFMPVGDSVHEKAILAREVDATDGRAYGLQNETSGGGIILGASQLEYSAAASVTTTLTANLKYKNTDKVPMTVMPAYTEYFEETYRRGINLSYTLRKDEGVFGSAGIATIDTHYYWNDALRPAPPSQMQEQATVDTIIFSVDHRSQRYVSIDPIASMTTSPRPSTTTLRYNSPVNGTHTAYIYLRVRYSNGVEQYDTAALTLKYERPTVTAEAVRGPVVRGAVYGGGRMANVGGATVVTVHGADSIGALYGGNDIAGWVQGDAGATLTIGTSFTDENHPVHIGNVYGGGNGYYTYRGINMSPIYGYPYRYGSTALQYQNYYFGYKWNGIELRPVDTNWVYNPAFVSQAASLGITLQYKMHMSPLTGQMVNTPYFLTEWNDFCGRVYEWGAIPEERAGYISSYTAFDSTFLEWDETKLVSEDYCFTYDPVVADPDVVDQSETGNGGNGTIPYIKTAHITVGVPEVSSTPFLTANGDSTYSHNNYVVIDTLFGGARNAFIGVTSDETTPENGVSIDINGGTLYAVFGGNNEGGAVANNSTVFVNVNDTKLIGSDEEIEDTYLAGYGRDFGIRYLFGGGNLVDGSHANVTIRGGMIDTVFLGGNNATVENPVGTVECLHGDTNQYGYPGHFICTNTTYPDPRSFSNPVAKLAGDESFFDNYGPENFDPENGKYNIRCLFGGNNAADMANLSAIQLHSGGISTVYGGGNQGDMNNNTAFVTPIYRKLFSRAYDLDLTTGDPISGGWADIYGKASLPNKVGSIVTALHDSKIVCDYVFGGGRMGNIKNSCGVYLAGGIFGYVNGGNDISGDIGSETGGGAYVVLDSNVLIVGDAIAGSDGYYHCDDGTGHYDDGELFDTYAEGGDAVSYDPYNDYEGMLFPTHNNVNFYMRGGLVLGQVIGGGVHANVGFETTNATIKKLDDNRYSPTYGQRIERPLDLSAVGGEKHGSIHFLASGGRVLGNAFGGGFQSKTFGLAYLSLQDSIQIDGAFFSGNDCTGSIQSFGAYINPNDLLLTEGMSAADSAAAYDSAYAAMVTSDGSALNSKSGTSWSANYEAYLRIKGTPHIATIYGSGNGAYDYDGNHPEYDYVSFCPDPNGTLTPKQSSTFIDINTEGGTIGTVFGGGNGVGVERSVVVLLNNTDENVHTVHTIFGGNNRDDMLDVVPEIRLTKGIVNTVFGGSNNGVMGFMDNFVDAAGHTVSGVSTHVKLNSDHVTVLDTIFGGNRMSDVLGGTFVEVLSTKGDGVNYIFGGNDISGNINGNTRIDVSGGTVHNIFGGSNGRYDFVETGDNLFNIYSFGFVDRNPSYFDGTNPNASALTDSLITVAGRPDVDSTHVNIWGGVVGSSNGGVYGGGSMADCRITSVVVNDTLEGVGGNAIIYGSIFGGGMGDYENLNNRTLQGDRYGNVTEATHVELYHAAAVTSGKAYGGGRGGDVMNTYITTYDGWTTPFDSLYGGCWGSDVFGTTHVSMNGQDNGEGNYNVKNLFGGNDFAGDVYKAEVMVDGGRYFNVYGGSNGDYPLTAYTSNGVRRPNVEYINLTFNQGAVDSNVYGGGKMGSTFAYKKNATGEYFRDANGLKVPDTALSYQASHSAPLDYSYIIVNVHDGNFKNNIFAGARGSRANQTPLVYGLKVLNMDGGYVGESLYGGSESVHDGYPAECKSSSLTTRRPSSIINLTGGTVENNLYGAGYLGLTYGSAYVNLGPDAIDSCVAYKQAYQYDGVGSSDSAYRIFKPGEAGSLSPVLTTDDLLLNHSLYSGSNWGNGHGSADFTARGFYGGESKIRVDGKDYNTDNNELNSLPQMNIQKSIFCSGTSVEGGDVNYGKEIDIWNYGAVVNCQPTKKLESVQRGDNLLFHNTAIELTGATDATSAYHSNPYTLNHITNVDFRGYNVIELDAGVDNVPELHFYEEPLVVDGRIDSLVPVQTLRQHTSITSCDDTATTCSNLEVVDPDVRGMQHTLLILNNGIDVQIRRSNPTAAGLVSGFGYVSVPQEYSSTILATATNFYGMSAFDYFTWEDGYSGFTSPCDAGNQYTEDRGAASIAWRDPANNQERQTAELPYTNYSNSTEYGDYRVWKVGSGSRLREATILAHTDPTVLSQDVSLQTHGNSKMAVAEASLTLPSTSTGHYYKVISGINLVGENETVNLIDSAFVPAQDFEALNTLYNPEGTTHGTVDGAGSLYGAFLGTTLAQGGVPLGVNEIVEHPTSTFGLAMVPGKFFDGVTSSYYRPEAVDFVMPSSYDPQQSLFIISGNSHVTSIQDYCSPRVMAGDALTPVMKFYLTYNIEFSSSFLGTVTFTMMEYDENGTEVAPIEVKVYISTIIEEFKPITTNVLAMYNAGRSNTFSRKVVLPATLEENRQLYVKSVKWVPTDCNGNDSVNGTGFYLVGEESAITGAPANVRNRFALNIIPSDNLSSDVSSAIGWSHINMPDINLFGLKTPAHSAPSRYSDSTGWQQPRAIDFTAGGAGDGLLIGTLDGRGTAVLDVQLTFDGTRRYSNIKGLGYVGKVELTLESRLNGVAQEFPLTIYVKTRENGDTIYIASASAVTRGGQTVRPYEYNTAYQNLIASASPVDKEKAAKMVGKSPNCYVRTFQEALSTKVYQEGDVLCILDTVKIEGGLGIAIHGGDGAAVEVIRYEAHHHEMAQESGVYRGPMIRVSRSGSKFTATNIAFDGSAEAHIRKGTPLGPQVLDTNQVFAPIIQVTDNGAVTLSASTTVQNNWNAYGSDESQLGVGGLPADAAMMGAISVTRGGVLALQNNVTIAHNLSHTYNGDNISHSSYDALRPYNGAVYVDGGRVVLPQSNAATAVDITRNWLVDPNIHSSNPTMANAVKWWKNVEINGTVVRWEFDETKVAEWQKANLFLMRKAATTGDVVMNDAQSDVVTLTGFPAPATRIGVRKWFPGLTERDTIRLGVCGGSNLTTLSQAVKNGNFVSDDDQRVFYNAKVNNNAIYLFRCATFRHQQQGVPLPVAVDGYTPGDVLRYGILERNSCPVGGDTLIYRLQGGFAPYTYTWTGDMTRTYTTPYPNTLVQSGLNDDNPEYYLASIADTLLTSRIDMGYNEYTKVANITVKAVDATGECELSKNIRISLNKVGDLGGHDLWEPVTTPSDGWSSIAATDTAVGDRYYRAVKITPYVWTDAAAGKISAMVDKGDGTYDRIIYRENGDEGHGLDTLLFCEGDVIRLKTQPSYAGAQFLMWSFDPFNENPATFVVPSYDDEVIAYYGSKTYWSDTIDTPEEAGVANASTYTYSSRPTVAPYKLYSGTTVTEGVTQAGYVTTYNGDVHIYNENGLAWFVSIVNGLNGYQVRPFAFNTVYLHKKSDGTPYNMQMFLWTPLGSRLYGFRGRFIGVGSGDNDTVALADDDRVIISKIILNEPYMDYVGFFGLLDSASCKAIGLQDIFVRGGQYVGGFAAQAKSSTMDNCAVVSDPTKTETTSIIATNYVSGGMVGDAHESTIKNSTIEAKYTGNAVHSGGITGMGESDMIANNSVRLDDHMSGIYVGGITGNETSADDLDCYVNDLNAFTGDLTSNGYQVDVSWVSSANSVSVGWCYGESWDASTDNMVTVRGESTTLTIAPATGAVIPYVTIAVMAECSSDSNVVATTTVYFEEEGYDECPTYEISASHSVSSAEATFMSHYVTVRWHNISNYTEDSVVLSFCQPGNDYEDGMCLTRMVSANSNSYTINIDSIYNADMSYCDVLLYSLCNESTFRTVVYLAESDDGSVRPTGRSRKSVRNQRSLIANNYVQIVGNSKAQRVGGIAGRATNTDIMNNYVYGVVGGRESGGSVAAVMDKGTRAVENYSANGTSSSLVGHQLGGMLSNTAHFDGQGTRVYLDKRIHGNDNLTRVLNAWVRAHNGGGVRYFKSWRSAVEGENNGYPVFGLPEWMTILASYVVEGCDEVLYDGTTYTRDTTLTTYVVDSIERIDSVISAQIRLHYSTSTLVNDSVEYGSDYVGYGFSISAEELHMLALTLNSEGNASLILHDTLTGAFGCDSVVTLTLTFTGVHEEPTIVTEYTVKVFPNPTTSLVNVETEEMSHVEVYDLEGRRLQDYDANGSNKVTIDMTTYVSGIYFVRVHTPNGVVIQKVIKER